MFYAIDTRTNKIILAINIEDDYKYKKILENRFKDDEIINEILISSNVRENNYKDTYNNNLKFSCLDNNCNDKNVIYVNSLRKSPHFRHSTSNKNCSVYKSCIEFNNIFYELWFNLFKNEYRKPYWYNHKLEEISDENKIIMIRYSFQKLENIKSIENYSKDKIIWILSLDKRKYNKIFHYEGKIYIDFTGFKNDIPLYNSEKSIVYLDTGKNFLIKVLLDNYNYYGQEIEIINIIDFCNENECFFKAYPYRAKSIYFNFIMNEKNIFLENQERLLNNYNEANNKFINNNSLKNFIDICNIYDTLSISLKNRLFNYKFYNNKKILDEKIKNINKYLKENKEDNILNIYNEIKELKLQYNNIDCLNNYLNIDIYRIEDKYNNYITKIINNEIYKIYEDEINIILKNEIIIFESYTKYYIEIKKRIEKIKSEKQIEENIKKVRDKSEKLNKLIKEKKNNLLPKKNNMIDDRYLLLSNYDIKQLLVIINDNYKKILSNNVNNKSESFKYIIDYYKYITFHTNYDINKMKCYIINQENFINHNW
jgi:hypothetical protein